MALGLSRTQPRSARSPITPPAESNFNPTQEQDWFAQRGAVLFEAPGDLTGGFPGFADLGGEMEDATARISERFLIVDEGKPHGFGIPVSWLDGAALVSQPERDDPDLRVFFSDGTAARCFSIRFHPHRLAIRGGKRAERAEDALAAAGLIDAAPDEQPDFALPWERTREFDAEHVLWTGHASAPVRVGRERAPSEIWLSTESLIWGSSDGNGLNRVALSQLTDFSASRLKDRSGTPAVYLAVTGDHFGRYEIPFVFDQQETPDRNFRERGAFLAGLQSHAISEGNVAPLWQPWRLDVHPANWRTDLDAIEPGPSVASEPKAPIEMLGVRARLEGWLPKLHAFASRGLLLPTVEDERATVIAFGPEESESDAPVDDPGAIGMGVNDVTPSAASVNEIEQPLVAVQRSDEAAHSHALHSEPQANDLFAEGSVDEAAPCHTPQPNLVEQECFAEADNLTNPRATFDLAFSVPAEEEFTKAAEAGERSAALLDKGMALTGAVIVRDVPRSVPDPEPIYVPAILAQRFETAALGVLADALQVIDIRLETGSLEPLSRVHSLSAARDAAFAEIRALGASKVIKKRDVRLRLERLIDLHDAGIRLRSLVDLYDRGHLDNPELARLRSKLVANVVLTPLVAPWATAACETARPGETFFGV